MRVMEYHSVLGGKRWDEKGILVGPGWDVVPVKMVDLKEEEIYNTRCRHSVLRECKVFIKRRSRDSPKSR